MIKLKHSRRAIILRFVVILTFFILSFYFIIKHESPNNKNIKSINSVMELAFDCPDYELLELIQKGGISQIGLGVPKDWKLNNDDVAKLHNYLSKEYISYFTENGYNKFVFSSGYAVKYNILSETTNSEIKVVKVESVPDKNDITNYTVTIYLTYGPVNDEKKETKITGRVRCDEVGKIGNISFGKDEMMLDKLLQE